MVQHPRDLFGRRDEWQALVEFSTSPVPHASLGIVSGRRRQGKTFLLQALCESLDGIYFSAAELTGVEALRSLGELIGSLRGGPPVRLDSWPAAIDALLALVETRPRPIVIDEFPYLARAVPELPSLLQAALAPRRRECLASRARLILCGSSLSFMGGLLSGSAPLRGRASLELVVKPFDYRTAAMFWSAEDPALALRLHAAVGGTPAYRREFVDDAVPSSLGSFDSWVVRRVLDPRSPLFREARYLLADETEARDVSAYHAVLTAVASGDRRRSAIAARVGRSSAEIGHHLTVLEDNGLLDRRSDAFTPRKPRWEVAEPLLAFYETIMRAAWPLLERGRGREVWARAKPTFESQILGPHLEQLAREWVLLHAGPDVLGGVPTTVESAVVRDPVGRTTHEIDIVALDGDKVLALGEVKLGATFRPRDRERLEHIRTLLGARASGARPLLFGSAKSADNVRLADLYAERSDLAT